MTTKQDRHILIAIIALSVLLRVVVALFLGNAIEETRGGTFDQISYDALALRVAGGHGFSFATDWWPGVRADQPTAFWSYLYTLYLAVVYTLFGHAPLIARLIQAVIVGAAMPWLTWRIGGRIFGRRPALIAAAISAVYFYFILYAASLMSEALYIVGVLWTVDAAMRLAAVLGDAGASAGRRWRLGLELGLAMGVTLLLRQAIAPFLAVLALWFLWLAWRRGWLRRAIGPLAAAALLMALLLLPFVVRNYRAFGVVGMPNTNVGINFFWANHPIYGTQFEAVLSPEHGISYQELIPPELRGLNDALLDRALLDRGVQIVLDDPGRYLLLSLSRIPIYFQFWPTPQSSLLSNAARLLSFGLFLPFMLYGLVLALVDARRGRFTAGAGHPGSASEPPGEPTQDLRLAYLSLVLCFMATYTLVHIASWANVRYRLPVDAFWILFAGYAIDNLLHRLSNRRAHSPSPINHSPIHHSPIPHSQLTIPQFPIPQLTIPPPQFTIPQLTIPQFTIHQFTIPPPHSPIHHSPFVTTQPKTSEVAGPDEKSFATLKPGLIAHPATSEVSIQAPGAYG